VSNRIFSFKFLRKDFFDFLLYKKYTLDQQRSLAPPCYFLTNFKLANYWNVESPPEGLRSNRLCVSPGPKRDPPRKVEGETRGTSSGPPPPPPRRAKRTPPSPGPGSAKKPQKPPLIKAWLKLQQEKGPLFLGNHVPKSELFRTIFEGGLAGRSFPKSPFGPFRPFS